jgi:hypothetical protein
MDKETIKFAEEHKYDLEDHDEGGYIGINTNKFAELLQKYADQQTKHLTEQLAEYKGIAQTESVRADNLQDQLAEKEKECEDILKWTLHNYKPYEDGMTMVWRNINPDVDTLHTSKELYEIFKTRKQWKQ